MYVDSSTIDLGGSPAEIAVLSALNPKADCVDVSGCDAIFDLLGGDARGRLSFEALRLGVGSDAVLSYIRETGNVAMKGLLLDWEAEEARVDAALDLLDPRRRGWVGRSDWRRFVVGVARERVRHLRTLGLVAGRCYWGRGLEDRAAPVSRVYWFLCGCLPRGYLDDFIFYARNNHPALARYRDEAHPFSPLEVVAAEIVIQCYCCAASVYASNLERPWNTTADCVHNAGVTLAYISVPVLVLTELLFLLLACPCVRYERRGRARERCFAVWQRLLEVVGYLVVLPLVAAALCVVGYGVYLLAAFPGAQAKFLLWWAVGLGWSYAAWVPIKLAMQFNLFFGGRRTAFLAKTCAVGRWAHERRTAATNALRFGDDDDDELEMIEEPWRVFES